MRTRPRRPAALRAATEALSALDASLRGVPGLSCLLGDPAAVEAAEDGTARVERALTGFEAALEAGGVAAETAQLEEFNAALVKARDVLWALRRDRLEAARSVAELVSSLGLSHQGLSDTGLSDTGLSDTGLQRLQASTGTDRLLGPLRSACSGPSTSRSGHWTASRSGGGTRPACT